MCLERVIYFRLCRDDDTNRVASDDRRRLTLILRWHPDTDEIDFMDHPGRRRLLALREGDSIPLDIGLARINEYLDLLRTHYRAQADATVEGAKIASTDRFVNELALEALRDITATRIMLERA